MKRLKPILFIAGGFFFGLNALEAGSRPSGEGLHGAVALALAAAFCMVVGVWEMRTPSGSNTSSPGKPRVQFSLRKLLLLVAVIASSLATFGAWGIAITLFVIIQAICIRRAAGRVQLVAIWGLIFLLGSCAAHGHREGYRLGSCRNNLRTIGLALHNYHAQHGRFPPAYVADAAGRPMHSWRVLILPYLQESDAKNICEQYRFDEPWNSPHNQKLAAQVPFALRCVTTSVAEPGAPLATHYVAVTGPGTAWPGPTGACVKDMVDGTDKTIHLVEIAGSDIHWMEPRDVTLEEALVGDKGACAVPSSHHYVERTYFFMNTYPLTGHVLMADGSCLCLRKRPSREDLAASLSIAGGEPADRDIVLWSSRESPIHGLDASRCLGFAVYVAFLALLVW